MQGMCTHVYMYLLRCHLTLHCMQACPSTYIVQMHYSGKGTDNSDDFVCVIEVEESDDAKCSSKEEGGDEHDSEEEEGNDKYDSDKGDVMESEEDNESGGTECGNNEHSTMVYRSSEGEGMRDTEAGQSH